MSFLFWGPWHKEIKNSFNSWYSKCGLWTGGICIVWELIGHAMPRFGFYPKMPIAKNAFDKTPSSPSDFWCALIFMKHCIRPLAHNSTLHGIICGVKTYWCPSPSSRGSDLIGGKSSLTTGVFISWNNKIRWE